MLGLFVRNLRFGGIFRFVFDFELENYGAYLGGFARNKRDFIRLCSALLKNKTFWLYALIMACAGASENSVSQWASTFVEKSLGLPKSLGDLSGPAFFAICMGTCRLLYGKSKSKMPLETLLLLSGLLCLACYLQWAFADFRWDFYGPGR